MLLCIRQEKCVTSEMVAYIEQWFGGLVSEMSYCGEWCSVMFHAVSLWFAERTCWLEARRKTETTDLIVLTFFKHLHPCLDSAAAFQWFVYVLSLFSSSLCLLSAYLRAYLQNVFYSLVSLPICRVTFMFLFVCLSVSQPGCQLSVCCQDILLTHSD